MIDIAILGNRAAGNLAAAYLRLHHPDLHIAVIGPDGTNLPSVGESTVECTVMFMKEIGVLDWMHKTQAPKGGLTFYYKLDPDAMKRESYYAIETPVVLKAVSKQLNRPVVDQHLRDLNVAGGVEYIDERVVDVELSTNGGLHELVLQKGKDAKDKRRVQARYLIDCTGRSQLLGRKLGLVEKPKTGQRSTYWFRLADFDRSLWLRNVEVKKTPHNAYDPYFCTHHFMGRGNWMWFIPLKSEEHKELISIGITWRPDLFPGDIRSVEDFLAFCDKENPSLSAFIRSGKIVDTATYRDYLQACRQYYSPDRWFIIGDAARAVDPLYSTGLVFTTLQTRQVSAMIGLDRQKKLTREAVEAFDKFIVTMQETMQGEITRHYDVMHDPFQSHLRVQWDTNQYEHFHLPLLARGFHLSPEGVRWMSKNPDVAPGEGSTPPIYTEQNQVWKRRSKLLATASKWVGKVRADKMIDVYRNVLNYNFDGSDSPALSRMLAKGFFMRGYLRMRILHAGGWHGAREQVIPMVKDFAQAALVRVTGERLLPKITRPAAPQPMPARAPMTTKTTTKTAKAQATA